MGIQELDKILLNVEKDNCYRIIEVLKETDNRRTEKVSNKNNEIFIRKYFKGTPEARMKEFRVLSQLDHPSVPKVYDYYELNEESVLIEEFIDGIKLSDFIRYSGKLTYKKTIEITLKLCEAVLFLHQQKPDAVIHRDIKPDNIIYKKDGRISLIDFDAARYYNVNHVKDTVYVGTLGYASPEQFGFGQTDVRTDIYAIGMTMLHMISGKEPERGNSKKNIDSNLPILFQKIINKAIEFDPANRYIDVSDLITDLNNVFKKSEHYEVKIRPQELDLSSFQKKMVFIYPQYLICSKGKRFAIMSTIAFFIFIFFLGSWVDTYNFITYANLDYFLKMVKDFFIIHVFFFICLLLGFNLFNINERFYFFHRHRIVKKIIVFIIITILISFLQEYLGSFQSEVFKFKNLAGS